MSNKQELKRHVIKPTLDYLESEGLIIRTTNGAGAKVYVLTEKGEDFLNQERFGVVVIEGPVLTKADLKTEVRA